MKMGVVKGWVGGLGRGYGKEALWAFKLSFEQWLCVYLLVYLFFIFFFVEVKRKAMVKGLLKIISRLIVRPPFILSSHLSPLLFYFIFHVFHHRASVSSPFYLFFYLLFSLFFFSQYFFLSDQVFTATKFHERAPTDTHSNRQTNEQLIRGKANI